MAYELKITATTADDLAQHISTLAGLLSGTAATAVDPVMPEVKKARGSTKAEAAADPKPEPVKAVAEIPAAKEPEPVVEETKVEEPAAETSDAPLDFQKDVLPRVFKLTEAHGRDAVVAVLSEFGVPKASQVPPEKFAEFVAAVNKAIG